MSTKLGTLTLDLVARIGSFTQGMRDASASAEREMGRAGNSVNTMDGLLKKLAATAGAVFSVSQIANYADSYSGMVNKLKLVTQTQGELSEAMNSTYKIAQATASDWESVITVYTKFQKISEKLGLSQEDVSRITETVTKAVSMSGATADEAQRALMQFGQALNTGALKGQDLNSILSQTPGLTDAIAEGMGVASGSLKELGAAGKLTNEMVISSLQKVASSVDDKYAETATLISSSFDLVKNSAKKMIGEFDAANGVSAKFVAGMTGIAENLE
ncbi:MAG: tape measure protein, partial [Kurthia sp.]|nr:tape measure protein [Candidatus Kurthia equi]